MKKKDKQFKRLFFDIETSYNVIASWRIGYNLTADADSILKERAIICICYKYEGDNKVYSLKWDKGCDKKMLIEFAKIMNEADEVIGHNSDKFDIKWVRTRCIKHGIPLIPDFKSLDTLKLSKKGFYFNSNKLNYIGQFLNVGKKLPTGGFELWKQVVEHNNQKALKTMVDYCCQDVKLLEAVYDKLSPYIQGKTHRAIAEGKTACNCPECTSARTISNGVRISASGIKSRRLQCLDCGRYFQISETVYQKIINE